MWNTCWWYDVPAGACVSSETDREQTPALLCDLLERWRLEKRAASKDFFWLRALWPPAQRLGETQSIRVLAGHQSSVTSIAWSPDAMHIATGSRDGTVRIWNADYGSEVTKLNSATEQYDSVFAVAWSPDGKHITSGGSDSLLRIWDAATGCEVRRLRPSKAKSAWVRTVSYSPDGRLLASGASDFYGTHDNSVRLWDRESGAHLRVLGKHKRMIRALTWSADSTSIVSGGDDAYAYLWNLSTGTQRGFSGSNSPVLSVAISPNGAIIVAGCWDSKARVWDISRGVEVACLPHREPVQAVAFAYDGCVIISATGEPQQGSAARVSTRNSIHFWDAITFREIKSCSLHGDGVTCLGASPKDTRIASGSEDHTARIFYPDTAPISAHRSQHQAAIRSIAISPDDSLIASGDIDGSVFLWDTKSGNQIRSLFKEPLLMIGQLWFSPDGSRLTATVSHKSPFVEETVGETLAYVFSGPDFADANFTVNPDTASPTAPEAAFVIVRCTNEFSVQSKKTGEIIAWFPMELIVGDVCALSVPDTWVVAGTSSLSLVQLEGSKS